MLCKTEFFTFDNSKHNRKQTNTKSKDSSSFSLQKCGNISVCKLKVFLCVVTCPLSVWHWEFLIQMGIEFFR
jgi:hypothetical protein